MKKLSGCKPEIKQSIDEFEMMLSRFINGELDPELGNIDMPGASQLHQLFPGKSKGKKAAPAQPRKKKAAAPTRGRRQTTRAAAAKTPSRRRRVQESSSDDDVDIDIPSDQENARTTKRTTRAIIENSSDSDFE
jgi:hypothetical protein